MKRSIALILCTAALLPVFLRAQAPTPGAPATTAPAKPKPYSSSDIQKFKTITESLQFHIRMGEIARNRGKDNDPEFGTFGTKVNKEASEHWNVLINLAQAHEVASKDIASAVSNADKASIDKLGKAKADKWKLEYFELFAKEAKKNATQIASAAKGLTDPELKAAGEKAATAIQAQAAMIETEYKNLKSPAKK